ncbi:MAG: hypothetical protein LV479_05900 [Methylacidiphilales bacterium]|nr:hypothetical protein [Candidatus Methylacidiphilales bacterium]
MKPTSRFAHVFRNRANRRFLALTLGGLALGSPHALALDPVLPGNNFDASRYEAIWTKSPFAVASPEASQTSSQYQLVGIAKIDDVAYANLIDSQNGSHFLLFTTQPKRGLKLISVELPRGGSPARAILEKDGRQLCLEMEVKTNGLAAFSPASSTAPTPDAIAAPGRFTNVTALVPPEGGTLPLVFQPVDTSKVHFTEEQVAVINQLRQDFSSVVSSGANGKRTTNTTGNLAPTQTWQTAQEQNDERLETMLGSDAYSQYQNALIRTNQP